MSDKTKEVKKPEVNPEILAMSEIIQKNLPYDKAGVVTPKEKLIESTLPDDLTMEMCEKVNKHANVFAPAAIHAFGRVSFEVLKAHKGMKKVEVTIPTIGKDKVHLVADREYISHPPTDPTKDIVTYNKVTLKHELRAANVGSQVRAIRAEMHELAMAALSK